MNSNYTSLHLLLVIIDSLLTISFLVSIVFHVIEDQFNTLNDKVIECIIGLGLPVICLCYAFFDAVRFLNNTFDRSLFIFSCFLF
jgi:hypothetical protein